ncbi:MAG: alcohol dehydrogenase catalytic domain-containing protein, partial [Armatimonadetes bacterium]|nr:alcohol dehydrogenase catalytic domain-containing protein [Armatimonadota bacterium]
MVPKTMRAVVLYEHGDVDKLIYEDAYPVPAFGPLDLLVQVKAVGLNHLDVFVRRGMPGKPVHFPRITGGDIAGVVATVGTRVTGVQVGQRVLIDPAINDRRGALGEDDQGGLAEFARAPGANAIPLPDDVSFEDAAALPIAFGTAWRMLFSRGRLRAGEHVRIGGSAGGVGSACVQIAK